MIAADVTDRVLDRITEQDLLELVLHITSVETPPGEEGPGAEVILEWLADNDFSPRPVGMFEDRFNIFAAVRGSGRGPALAFNSHIDTWMRRDDHLIWRDPGNDDFHLGREDDDLLIGNPVTNDKGPMAAWMIAAKAIRDAGVKLDGSIYLTMVAGEIGQEPVEQGGGRALPREPHAAREHLRLRRGPGIQEGLDRGGQGLLQDHGLRRAGALHALRRAPLSAGRAPERDRARASPDPAPRGVGARV